MNLVFVKELRLIAWKAMARFPRRTQVAQVISDPAITAGRSSGFKGVQLGFWF